MTLWDAVTLKFECRSRAMPIALAASTPNVLPFSSSECKSSHEVMAAIISSAASTQVDNHYKINKFWDMNSEDNHKNPIAHPQTYIQEIFPS